MQDTKCFVGSIVQFWDYFVLDKYSTEVSDSAGHIISESRQDDKQMAAILKSQIFTISN